VNKKAVTIYTDGSCNPAFNVGGWAALIFIDEKKIILKGIVENTTHQRMELQAIIEALEFLTLQKITAPVIFYTDSQYAVDLPKRKDKLVAQNFTTKANNIIRNDDLLRRLISLLDAWEVYFVKVKAHQQKAIVENYNREVDKLVRQMVRQRISVINNVERKT
jgi:ribonuclease HI